MKPSPEHDDFVAQGQEADEPCASGATSPATPKAGAAHSVYTGSTPPTSRTGNPGAAGNPPLLLGKDTDTAEESLTHTEKDTPKDWAKVKAAMNAPDYLPPHFRAIWKSAYLATREEMPIIRERVRDGKRYIVRKTPTVLDVMNTIITQLLSGIAVSVDKMNHRVNELTELAGIAGWATLLTLSRVRLMQLLLSEEENSWKFGVRQVISHIEKVLSPRDRAALAKLVSGDTDTEEDVVATIRDQQERQARVEALDKEVH